ncbi:MAG: NfeD family protein [Oscillospiraceae bacterium]|jgi:membrane protein implicated in regulation of membrane protease activity|nr:NfeD family protein [Oscillospiraceae bacterium]
MDNNVNITLIIWLIVTVASVILEALSMQLFSIWFAVGGLAAVISNLVGANIQVQAVLFVVVTGAALIATRPLVKHLLLSRSVPTNSDMVIGQVGTVVEAISNLESKGIVKVGGQEWTARSEDGSDIPEGNAVNILRVEGVKLIVRQ